MVRDVKIIDRNNETHNFKNVKTCTVLDSGVLAFVDADGVEHYTNEEFHVTITQKGK